MVNLQEAPSPTSWHGSSTDQAATDLWFAAIHLIDRRTVLSSVELGRRLGVKQPIGREAQDHGGDGEGETALTGRVDESGGVRSGGTGAENALRGGGLDQSRGAPAQAEAGPVIRLPQARDRARRQCTGWPPAAAVVTDRLGCWSALDEAACSHQAIRTGSGRQAARMASFKWVNTTLGNIKSAITGTYRKLGPDHAGRYLASFA